ncbi:MAG: hypothetical protein V4534_05315 [Myxococcota bacterium]
MNLGKVILSVICIMVLWFGLDSVFHGIILAGLYEQTAHLWRPLAEMDHVQGTVFMAIYALLFVLFYQTMVRPKNLAQGLKFGCWYGVICGFAMGGMYLFMPIPLHLAFGWFICTWLESVIAGLVVGYFLKNA